MAVSKKCEQNSYNHSDFFDKPHKFIDELDNSNDAGNYANPIYLEIISNLPEFNFRNYDLADFKYENIKVQIEHFQNSLSDEYDVMVQMATFGKEIIMAVEDIGYQNPDVLYFYGKINGQYAQLIQHQSQLNFLLLACKKEDPNKRGHRIGFVTDDNK